MNKTEFLLTLQKQLSLLEDDEQADIIDEYSQHIEMKVKSGMTEEEAIADFGPIDQLIGEILGAYHVKAPAKASAAQSPQEEAPAKPGMLGTSKAVEGGKRAAANAASAVKGCFSKLDGIGESISRKRAEKKAAAFEKGGKDAANTGEKTPEGIISKTGKCARNMAYGFVRSTSQVGAGTLNLTKNLLRWFWNICVACVAAFFLLCSITFLFAFGFCIVLSIQGYPMFGICLASLGLFLASLSLGLLSLRLIKRKAQEKTSECAPHNSTATATCVDSRCAEAAESQVNTFVPAEATEPLPRVSAPAEATAHLPRIQ